MQTLSHLSDDDLLHDLLLLIGSQRRVIARIVAHLGEVDTRRLYAKRGFSSLFSYCVEVLAFSEDEACRRIEAARLACRFRCIGEALESGTVTLTVLGLLKPHLTEENHRDLLAGVSGMSVRRAKECLAARFPQPDVPSSIRKCPEMSRALSVAPSDGLPAPTRVPLDTKAAGPSGAVSPSSPSAIPLLSPSPTPAAQIPSPLREVPKSPARIDALSRDRFLVKLTVDRAVKEKLELARDLMRHRNPEGDLAVVLERALDLLIADLSKSKLGQTKHPKKKPRPAEPNRITSSARREVVERDGLRCSFVSAEGRRCESRAFLEFDHVRPRGLGGTSEMHNLRLTCRTHNLLAAEIVYGEEFIQRKISPAQRRRSGAVESPG
jgi:hypothetical protein